VGLQPSNVISRTRRERRHIARGMPSLSEMGTPRPWAPHRAKSTPFAHEFASSAPSTRRIDSLGLASPRRPATNASQQTPLQLAAATAEQLRVEQCRALSRPGASLSGPQSISALLSAEGTRREMSLPPAPTPFHQPQLHQQHSSMLATPRAPCLGESPSNLAHGRRMAFHGPGSQLNPPTACFAGDERRRPFGRVVPQGMSTAQYAWHLWTIEEGEFRPSPKERLWTARYAHT
jgi:hypothetical protein